MKLTGRKRYRSARTLFGKDYLVLQLEYTTEVAYMSGRMPELSTVTKWRDATIADLTTEGTGDINVDHNS